MSDKTPRMEGAREQRRRAAGDEACRWSDALWQALGAAPDWTSPYDPQEDADALWRAIEQLGMVDDIGGTEYRGVFGDAAADAHWTEAELARRDGLERRHPGNGVAA